jgi:ABC-2 type transport system permease protein
MRSFLAFTRKEITYQARSGKLMLLIILFTIIGIMNPAFAKLTPWMLEAMADSMAESGINITATTITALDSWTQFFKNAPIALIAFVLLEGSLFTTEYESGTLVLSLTKGLSRYKVVLSKALVLIIMWSLGYWLCFGITYGYTAYFWDNSIAQHLWLSIILWWIFGLWVISLMVLFSVLSKTSSTVLVGTGTVAFGCYLMGSLPKIKDYVPTMLTNGKSLVYGIAKPETYTAPLLLSITMILVFTVASIPLFSKKKV